jgi:Reverse transcriptase (RNA-dependent DNA polymerase)
LEDYVVYSIDNMSDVSGFTEDQDPRRLYANATSSDPDVMYLHQAMQAPDKIEFIKAMEKEVNSHIEKSNWTIIDRSAVPAHQPVLPAVWAMRRKRDIATQQVYKWKARLNIHGGKQEKGVNYWETYAPVASWLSIRLIMNIAVLSGWTTRQLDFVLAFPQAPVETDLYMEIPQGFNIDGSRKNKVLKLVNNLYGQKQAGRVWNLYLTAGLVKLGFTQCHEDPCIFWRGTVMIIIYTDDTIVTGPNTKDIDQAVTDIASLFEITVKDTLDNFLGVKITRNEFNNTVQMTQPQLIDAILNDLQLQPKSNSRHLPALVDTILHKFVNEAPHSDPWHYRSIVGKLNYLEKCTRPELAYAVHQCARFSENPKFSHSKAIKHIGRYLLGTRDQGMICTPKHESLVCYCDADFSGNWNASIAEDDPSTARSRTGYIIFYDGCPVIWSSRLQTEIALSSTESVYISLSQALREVIPLMRLIKELHNAGFDVPHSTPEVHCKVFEDNSGALIMAQSPKIRPRTKHINIKYHHFRQAVENKDISIHKIDTKDQLADILTKPLTSDLFFKFRLAIMGW